MMVRRSFAPLELIWRASRNCGAREETRALYGIRINRGKFSSGALAGIDYSVRVINNRFRARLKISLGALRMYRGASSMLARAVCQGRINFRSGPNTNAASNSLPLFKQPVFSRFSKKPVCKKRRLPDFYGFIRFRGRHVRALARTVPGLTRLNTARIAHNVTFAARGSARRDFNL